jgi:DUF4097 and DUF4098 domain-containing protein YvlB
VFRAIRLLPLFLALTSGSALAGLTPRREQSTQDVPGAGLKAVRIVNARGEVLLQPSADGQVHLTALKLVRANSTSESERMSRDMRVDTRIESGQFVVEVHYPSTQSIRIGFWDLFSDFEIPSAEVRIGVQLPPGLAVQVRCVSGDIHSHDVTGQQTLESTSGDVDIDSPNGAVAVTSTSGDVTGEDLSATLIRTVSGDVEIRGARGPLDTHTTSGDVNVHGAQDSIRVGTVSGDVTVHEAPRGIDISTTTGDVVAQRVVSRASINASSGNVELGLSAPFSRAQVTTSSGDIRVELGTGVGGEVELRTSNGSLDTKAAMQVGTLTRRVITGRVGQGSALIQLRSASGDIHLSTGDRET